MRCGTVSGNPGKLFSKNSKQRKYKIIRLYKNQAIVSGEDGGPVYEQRLC